MLYPQEFFSEWTNLGYQATQRASKYNYTLTNLMPKSRYDVRLAINYSSEDVFFWPNGKRFVFSTLGDKPSKPGTPFVTNIAKDVFQVEWQGSESHGGENLYYILEFQYVLFNVVSICEQVVCVKKKCHGPLSMSVQSWL